MNAEQQLLYVIFREGSLINQLDLVPSDFPNQTDAMIFDAMQQVAANNEPIDMISVGEYIENNHRQVNMSYLADIWEKGVGVPEHFRTYEKIIKSSARKRKAKDIAYKLIHLIDEKISGDHVSEAIRELMEIDQASQTHDFTFKDMMRDAVEGVQEAGEKDGLTGITTGLKDLDESIGGYHDSDLIIVAARPAMGKTAYLLSTMNASVRQSVIPGVISAEQNKKQVGQRLICIDGGINSQNMRTANLTMDEWGRFDKSVTRLQNKIGFINDKAGITITDLCAQARKWKFERNIQILFVDYLQKILGDEPDLTKQVAYNATALKNLAKELNIPVVALAQLNRDCEKRQDKRPLPSDIADSKSIEQEADVIMTLYRDVVYDDQTKYPDSAELNIVKNRHGPIGCIYCQYRGKYFQFKDFNEGVA